MHKDSGKNKEYLFPNGKPSDEFKEMDHNEIFEGEPRDIKDGEEDPRNISRKKGDY